MKKLISSFLASVKQNRLYWLALLCMGIAFYVMNVHTPFISDDYNYHYIYEPVSIGENETKVVASETPVNTLPQLLQSQCNHYLGVNGRFTTHCLVQLFCGILGKGWFNVFNALVFMLCLNTVNGLCMPKKKNLQLLMLSFALALGALPFPGQTMFWLSGALNYLWPATLCLLIMKYLPPHWREDRGANACCCSL